jgi:aminoglycoside phosphotransferase (APT) family kinase protein
MPAWREVRLLVARELGEPVSEAEPLVPVRRSGMTWAARAQRTGAIVIKIRHGDRAQEKTRRCAAHLPALGARGYPVPAIRWHGMIRGQWHVTVQDRLPGRPLFAPGTVLAGPVLDALLDLVELQADAGIPAGEHDFTGYVANVLFDDWDDVWADAAGACATAGELCARLRRWLQPVWGLRLPAADYAHNDLNLSNVLTDGAMITGVVDWDEFGLGSRALDLVALAVDCERCGDPNAADRLLARAAQVAGRDGLLPGQLPCDRRARRLHPRAAGVRRFPRGRGVCRAIGHPRPAPGQLLAGSPYLSGEPRTTSSAAIPNVDLHRANS